MAHTKLRRNICEENTPEASFYTFTHACISFLGRDTICCIWLVMLPDVKLKKGLGMSAEKN